MDLTELKNVKLIIFGPGFCGENSITLFRQNDKNTKKEIFDLPVGWPTHAIELIYSERPKMTFGDRRTFYAIKTILEAITGKRFMFDYQSRKTPEKKWYREDTQIADKAKKWIKERRIKGWETLEDPDPLL